MSEPTKPLGTEVALYGSKLFRDDAVKLYSERVNVTEEEAKRLIRAGMKNLGMEVSPGPEESPEPEVVLAPVLAKCPKCSAPLDYDGASYCGVCREGIR